MSLFPFNRYTAPLDAVAETQEQYLELPQTVEVTTGTGVPASVVWLHGLGADGHDFEPIVPQLELPAGTEWRFVFPHAPVRPVTLNGGMRMRAWFDIYSLDRDGPVDEAGIRESAARLEALVEQQVGRGVPADRVVVAGFSQGGAVAAHFALRYAEPLAGLMVLSAYLPLLSTLQREVADTPQSQTRDLPVFMAHGTFDPVLPCQLGKIARDAMQSLGYKVQWFEYPMPHAVCPAEVTDIGHWLARCLPGSDQTS